MRVLLRIIIALVIVAVALVAAGFLMPKNVTVQRSAEIKAPADKIYPLINDPKEWKRWGAWYLRDPQMQLEYAGAPTGVGAKWSWRSQTQGNGSMEVTEATPNQNMTYTLTFPDYNMQSRGQFTFTPKGDATEVTWRMDSDLGSNPINRWFGTMLDKMVGPDFEAGLANLKKIAEGS